MAMDIEIKDCLGIAALALSLYNVWWSRKSDSKTRKLAYSSELRTLQSQAILEQQAQAGIARRARKLQNEIKRANYDSDQLRESLNDLQRSIDSADLQRRKFDQIVAELAKLPPSMVTTEDLQGLKGMQTKMGAVSVLTERGDPEFENLVAGIEEHMEAWKDARAKGIEGQVAREMNGRP